MFKRIFRIASIFIALTIAVPSFAQDITEIDIVEGYAETTYRELYTTMVMMGGLDIEDDDVANEYGRMNYCHLHQKDFNNDFEWNKHREIIRRNVKNLIDPFRVKYEVVEKFEIGRYDFEGGYFPILKSSAMNNLGTMYIFNRSSFQPYCGLEMPPTDVFPVNIRLNLNDPLNVNKITISKSNLKNVSKILDRIHKDPAENRYVYGRIRFTVDNASGYLYSMTRKKIGTLLNGTIDSVDFFYDEFMAHKVESVENFN